MTSLLPDRPGERQVPVLDRRMPSLIGVLLVGVGAAFWGLIAGLAISWLLERGDFAAAGSR